MTADTTRLRRKRVLNGRNNSPSLYQEPPKRPRHKRLLPARGAELHLQIGFNDLPVEAIIAFSLTALAVIPPIQDATESAFWLKRIRDTKIALLMGALVCALVWIWVTRGGNPN